MWLRMGGNRRKLNALGPQADLRFMERLECEMFELKELQRRQEEEERRRHPHKGPSPAKSPERVETTFGVEGGVHREGAEALRAAEKADTSFDRTMDSSYDGSGRSPLSKKSPDRSRLAASEPSSWRLSLSRSARFEPHDLRGTETGDGFEGVLIRKHTYESLDRKASNRSWEKLYTVLRNNQVMFFKDQRHRDEGHLYHSEQPIALPGCSVHVASDYTKKRLQPIALPGCSVHVASDYTKKRHVLSLRLQQGAEFLLQASSEDDMNRWLHYLQLSTGQTTHEPTRSQTMPEGGVKAKKGFFSLKKK
uniref:PH domain-containing protein n=1 Tax=Plectus sambesii TaxID=2011161 RepID=A0A914XQI1_9BILA